MKSHQNKTRCVQNLPRIYLIKTAMLEVTLDKNESRAAVTPAIPKTEIIYHRGRTVQVNGIRVGEKRLVVLGKLLTIARLQDEWYGEIGNPETIIAALKACEPRPDIFSFWQRLPDTSPIYPYYNEPEALSAIPLQTFKHWWEKQIKTDTRKKIKRPEKRGIEIKVVQLDDDFVRGRHGNLQ